MPRLVRRQPLLQRIQAYLNPYDFLLWLSEEIETSDWDTKALAYPVGAILNLIFLIACANRSRKDKGADDVFGDRHTGTGWFAWLSSLLVWVLTLLSLANTIYTFARKRHYRLFETSIEVKPSTPSAHRVRVDSSPISSSPLRFLSSILKSESAAERSHPEPTRDVWELAVWDPLPMCLQLFCLFSPGHVLVYWLFFPIAPSNPHPSTTVLTTIVLELLLSGQLLVLQANFSQQAKDSSVIHKEVMNEYDTKFVYPRLNGELMRDVGTQFTSSAPPSEIEVDNMVDVGNPTTILRRIFKTNPNPNYAKYVSPEDPALVPKREINMMSPLPAFRTPGTTYTRRESTPLRQSGTGTPIRQPIFRHMTSTGVSAGTGMGMGTSTGIGTSMTTNAQPVVHRSSSHNTVNASKDTGDGGSLGIFSHVNSPLKKATSMYDLDAVRNSTPMNNLQAAAREIAVGRQRAAELERRREKERERERSVSPVKKIGGAASGVNVDSVGLEGLRIGKAAARENPVERIRGRESRGYY